MEDNISQVCRSIRLISKICCICERVKSNKAGRCRPMSDDVIWPFSVINLKSSSFSSLELVDSDLSILLTLSGMPLLREFMIIL